MAFEPSTDLGGGVNRGVVEGHVQGVAAIAAMKEFEEAKEVRAGVPYRILADDLSRVA